MANPIKYTLATNLLRYSQQFDNGSWGKVNATVTAGATTSPDMTLTACKIVENTTSNTQYYTTLSNVAFTLGTYTTSVYAKAAERSWIYFEIGNSYGNINLSNGSVGTSGNFSTGWSVLSVSSVNVGNGWYRCIIVANCTITGSYNGLKVNIESSNNTIVYTGVIGNGIYIWGGQVEKGSVATAYIATTASSVTVNATPSNSIKTSNFAIGVNKGGYGPTNITNFYNGKTPNVGGYTVYVSNGSGSPSVFVAGNDATLITLSNQLGGSGITTIEAALNFFNASTTMLCTNMDYPNIVTDGLVLNLDATYTPSYPKNGNTWKDLSGYANNGTLTNGPTYSSAGGGSIGFDGIDDSVTIPHTTNYNLVSLTVLIWVKPTSPYTTYFRNLISKQGGDRDWNFYLYSSAGNGVINNFHLSTARATSYTAVVAMPNGSLSLDVWHQCGFSLSPGTTKYILDGIVISSTSNDFSGASSSYPIRIGGADNFTKGEISNTHIYNRVLSDTEILQNYYAGLQRSILSDGLVLSLDGSNTNKQVATASTTYDVSGNNNNGTLNNGVTIVGDGQRSFSFDGTNDYISIPNSSSLQLSTQIAISVWFKLLDTTPSGNTPTIIQKEVYNSAVNNQGFLFRVQMSNNSMYLALLNNGVYSVGSSANQIYTNIWYNAVGTYDGTQIKFYLNGVLKNTTNYSGGFLTNTQPLFIGQAATLYYMWGNIGQVQIYNRGLIESEVSAIYTTTRSRYESLQGTIDGFKSRLLRDIGIFEKETCLYDILSDLKSKSILDRTSLIITPNGYKENKLYSVMPNNSASDLTVTRSTTGTIVNSEGLIETVPYNLMTYSEEVENTQWTKNNITITQNSIISPNGTMTGDKLIEGTNNGLKYIISSGLGTVSRIHTASLYLRANTRTWAYLTFGWDNTGDRAAYFDLINGVVGNLEGGVTASIVATGDGWYRCTITGTMLNNAPRLSISMATGNGTRVYLGDGVSSIYAWGTQLVEGTEPKDYYPTTTRLNIPRIDYSNGGCPGALVEPQRTNLAIYSEQINLWTGIFNATVTPNVNIAPNGIQTSNNINITSTNGYCRRLGLNLINSTTYTASIFVKKSTTTNSKTFRFYYNNNITSPNNGYFTSVIDLTNLTIVTTPFGTVGTGAPTIISSLLRDYGSGWYRVIVVFTIGTSAAGSNCEIGFQANGEVVDFDAWGAQVELGTNVTSYIPTTTAAVTRNEDIIESSLLNYNTTSYSIFFDIEYFENFSVGSGDVTASPLIWYFRRLNSTSVNFWNQNAQQTLGSFTFSPANSIKRFKGCLVFNGSTISTFVNGTKVGNQITPTNLTPYTTFLNSNTNRIRTSKVNLIGTVDSSHKIKLIYIVPTSITDTEAINLTTI